MLVKNWMTTEVVTVEADNPIETAVRQFHKHGFAAFPVLQDRQLVGMLSETDLPGYHEKLDTRTGPPSPRAEWLGQKVADCMTRYAVTVNTDDTVEEAADRLLKCHVSSAPVLGEHGQLAGIIAMADLLRAVVSVTGAARQGIHLGIEVPDRPGSVQTLTDTIRRYGGRMASLFTTNEGAPDGRRRAYVRIFGIDRFKLQPLLQELREVSTLLYVIDRKEIRVER